MSIRRPSCRPFAAALLAVALALSLALPARAACRQALALGLDISGSVDAREFRLQLDGLAGALLSEDVSAALLAAPAAPVRLLVYLWSGPEDLAVVLDWTEVTSPGDLDAIARTLRAAPRPDGNPGTALGTALMRGSEFLAAQQACWSRTLDISGDGPSNIGPRPQDVIARLANDGITVNALVVGRSSGNEGSPFGRTDLASYFRELVARGPGSFVENANGFDDYEEAMTRKLMRELKGLAVSDAGRPQ